MSKSLEEKACRPPTLGEITYYENLKKVAKLVLDDSWPSESSYRNYTRFIDGVLERKSLPYNWIWDNVYTTIQKLIKDDRSQLALAIYQKYSEQLEDYEKRINRGK
jgi:hypothetical protein